MTELSTLLGNFVGLFIESAPWLLLGLFIAGVMHEILPVSLLQKHMGDSSVKSVVKAAVIGAPLPLCSCGVIPAALGLRRSGASKSSTISFLVATPETGVDSVSVSYALLGPVFAIVRPFAAIFSAIYAGLMVKLFGDERFEVSPMVSSSSCCHSKPVAQVTASCCASSSKPTMRESAQTKLYKTVQFASGKLLSDISLWLLIGLGLAAVIQTFVPTQFLTQWGDGLVAMLVMAVVGIPMYICATASTPVALGFLIAGLSPGAVLVFMLAGPATNISTMGMIAKEMGLRTLVLYLFSVISAAIALGYLLNMAFAMYQWALPGVAQGQHLHEGHSWLYLGCAVLLAVLMLRLLLLNGWQKWQAHRNQAAPASSCCGSKAEHHQPH